MTTPKPKTAHAFPDGSTLFLPSWITPEGSRLQVLGPVRYLPPRRALFSFAFPTEAITIKKAASPITTNGVAPSPPPELIRVDQADTITTDEGDRQVSLTYGASEAGDRYLLLTALRGNVANGLGSIGGITGDLSDALLVDEATADGIRASVFEILGLNLGGGIINVVFENAGSDVAECVVFLAVIRGDDGDFDIVANSNPNNDPGYALTLSASPATFSRPDCLAILFAGVTSCDPLDNVTYTEAPELLEAAGPGEAVASASVDKLNAALWTYPAEGTTTVTGLVATTTPTGNGDRGVGFTISVVPVTTPFEDEAAADVVAVALYRGTTTAGTITLERIGTATLADLNQGHPTITYAAGAEPTIAAGEILAFAFLGLVADAGYRFDTSALVIGDGTIVTELLEDVARHATSTEELTELPQRISGTALTVKDPAIGHRWYYAYSPDADATKAELLAGDIAD